MTKYQTSTQQSNYLDDLCVMVKPHQQCIQMTSQFLLTQNIPRAKSCRCFVPVTMNCSVNAAAGIQTSIKLSLYTHVMRCDKVAVKQEEVQCNKHKIQCTQIKLGRDAKEWMGEWKKSKHTSTSSKNQLSNQEGVNDEHDDTRLTAKQVI